MARNGTISTNQRKAIEALLATNTVAAAAEACGLSKRTIFRYLTDRHFMAALRERETEARARTTARLIGGAGGVLDTLEEIMNDPTAAPSARVAACRVWLSAADKGAETDVIMEKIAAIEEVVYAGKR